MLVPGLFELPSLPIQHRGRHAEVRALDDCVLRDRLADSASLAVIPKQQ